MKTRIEFEVETLRESLQAGAEALAEIERSPEGLSPHGVGMLDAYEHVIDWLTRILKEVSE